MTAKPIAPDPRPRPEGLAQLNFYLGRTYHNYRGLLEEVISECGLAKVLRPGMGPVLFALYARDNSIIKEIAQQTQLSHSTLTGILAAMERAGLITCLRDPKNRRAVRVSLTQLGRSLENRCLRISKKVESILNADLKPAEARLLKRLLSRVNSSIQCHRRPLKSRAHTKDH